MRELKYHEKKLLRKNKFYEPWKNENNLREATIMKRYQLTNRNDYAKYNMLVGKITKICHLLTTLPPKDPFRIKLTSHMTTKLYSLGLVNQQNSLEACSKITVSSFCRRRFPVILTVDKWVENIKEATQFIEQGHF